MQEYKCFKGGACLAVSLEALERLCKRDHNDQEIKKRDGSAQLWISRSPLTTDESEPQSFFCLCDCGSPNRWSITGITPSSVCPPPALDSCRNHRAFTTSTLGTLWTDLLNTPDNVTYFTKNKNCNPKEQIVILCNDNILTKLLSDAFDCGDPWPVGIAGLCINNNKEGVFKAIDPDRSNIPDNKDHHDQTQKDVINKEQTHRDICDERCLGEKSGGIRRKSVSFADDVIVYLYDKDSPTEESSSSPISDILFDDNGLEWEDDFLALEKSRQSHGRPESRRFFSPPLIRNWTVNRPKSFALSQSCMILTHVNESDLEL